MKFVSSLILFLIFSAVSSNVYAMTMPVKPIKPQNLSIQGSKDPIFKLSIKSAIYSLAGFFYLVNANLGNAAVPQKLRGISEPQNLIAQTTPEINITCEMLDPKKYDTDSCVFMGVEDYLKYEAEQERLRKEQELQKICEAERQNEELTAEDITVDCWF